MVGKLREGDVVSIIAYDTRVDTLLRATPVAAESRARAISALRNVTAGGNTCISCALEAGLAALGGGERMVRRMLLLSDGEPTAGVRDPEGLGRVADRVRQQDCSVSAIGVDVDYNERIMSAIARHSNGRHAFVENAAGLPAVFADELRSLLRSVAAGAELRVELGPGVQLLQLFDRTFRREGNTLLVPLGSFSEGDDKTLLIKLRLPRGSAGERELARVRLRFDDLEDGESTVTEGRLAVELTADPTGVSTELDPFVAARVLRAETAAVLTEANEKFARGDVTGARTLLAAKRQVVAARGQTAAATAPAERQEELKRDIGRQLAALDQAASGFAPPAAATATAPAPRSRPGKAAVRRNASAADAMAF
jgi:Ca-activated chloride channel family protein